MDRFAVLSAATGAADEGAGQVPAPDIAQLRIALDALATDNDLRPPLKPRDDLLARAETLEGAARLLGQPEMIGASLLRKADVLIAAGRADEAIEPLIAARRLLATLDGRISRCGPWSVSPGYTAPSRTGRRSIPFAGRASPWWSPSGIWSRREYGCRRTPQHPPTNFLGPA
jgi:hypothetical protein